MKIRILELLAYPFGDERWWKKLPLGWLVNFIPLLNFAASGYAARIYRMALKKQFDDNSLPEWDDWSDYLGYGIKIFVITFAYFLPVMILELVFTGWPLLVGILGMLVGFFLPLAIARFLLVGQLKAAFHFQVIRQSIQPIIQDYILLYFIALAFFFIEVIFLFQLNQEADCLSLLVFSGVDFYIKIILARMFGDILAPVADSLGAS